MRWLGWIVAAAGIVLVLVATGLIGDRDRSGDTVPAGEWAQDVCAAVGVWRGEKEAITESFREATEASDATETAAPTPEGGVGAVQIAVERSITAAETLVEGIERAGVPETSGGEQAAEQVSSWANGALNDLEAAEETLDEQADTLEEGVDQLAAAVGAIGRVITSGVQTIADIGLDDPELVAAFQDSSTCQQLREETG